MFKNVSRHVRVAGEGGLGADALFHRSPENFDSDSRVCVRSLPFAYLPLAPPLSDLEVDLIWVFVARKAGAPRTTVNPSETRGSGRPAID